MSVFEHRDVCNSLPVLPTCAIPHMCFFCERVTEVSEKKNSNVTWNFCSGVRREPPAAPHRGTNGRGAAPQMREAARLIPPPPRHIGAGACTSARLPEQGFPAALHQKGPVRQGVPSKGCCLLLSTQRESGIFALENSCITSDQSYRLQLEGTGGVQATLCVCSLDNSTALKACRKQQSTAMPSWHLFCKTKK